jgi:hypothetical protein
VGEGGLYKDDAALEGAYKNAERLIGKPKESTTDAPNLGDPALQIPDDPGAMNDDDVNVDGLLKKAGLDGKELAQSYLKDGKLDDKAYKLLALQGLKKAVVNEFMEGQKARFTLLAQQQAAIKAEAITIVGSEDKLDSMLKTAAQYVPANELPDLKERLAKPGSFRGALRDIMEHYAKHIGADGSAPLINGNPGETASGPIKTLAEFSTLSRLAERGDSAALARIRATPLSTVASWNR